MGFMVVYGGLMGSNVYGTLWLFNIAMENGLFIDDFPSYKPPFMVGIFHSKLLVITRWYWPGLSVQLLSGMILQVWPIPYMIRNDMRIVCYGNVLGLIGKMVQREGRKRRKRRKDKKKNIRYLWYLYDL